MSEKEKVVKTAKVSPKNEGSKGAGEPTEKRKIKGAFIPERIFTEMVSYLMSQPYRDVSQMMEALKLCPVIEQDVDVRKRQEETDK